MSYCVRGTENQDGKGTGKMKNIERFINNNKFYDEWLYGDPELVLSLKENPQCNLHVWDGYIIDITRDIKPKDAYWSGFTRDYQEDVRTFSGEEVELENLDEYINDLLLYKDAQFEFNETFEAYELILDFLTFAKENNLTVMAELY